MALYSLTRCHKAVHLSDCCLFLQHAEDCCLFLQYGEEFVVVTGSSCYRKFQTMFCSYLCKDFRVVFSCLLIFLFVAVALFLNTRRWLLCGTEFLFLNCALCAFNESPVVEQKNKVQFLYCSKSTDPFVDHQYLF